MIFGPFLPIALFSDIEISCFFDEFHKHCCHYISSKCIRAQIPLQFTYKCSSPLQRKAWLSPSLPHVCQLYTRAVNTPRACSWLYQARAHGYTMHRPMATPSTGAWKSHGPAHGVAMHRYYDAHLTYQLLWPSNISQHYLLSKVCGLLCL